MPKDYSHQNLQKVSFAGADLSNARFTDSDLRGTDFTGTNLTGADFTHVKIGIPPGNTVLIFLLSLVVSLLSGYLAMLTGQTIQEMLASKDTLIRAAGFVAIVMIVAFILYAYWKGGGRAIRNLILPASVIALLLGGISYWTGIGTGRGLLYLVLVNFLMVLMFIVGTVARATAGALSSNFLFLIVALGGGMFGKSLGGGLGTVIMAVSCALISKKALSGAAGFEGLRKFAYAVTSRFGTSFRNSRLDNAQFAQSKVRNADFSNADLSHVNWGDSKKTNCIN